MYCVVLVIQIPQYTSLAVAVFAADHSFGSSWLGGHCPPHRYCTQYLKQLKVHQCLAADFFVPTDYSAPLGHGPGELILATTYLVCIRFGARTEIHQRLEHNW